MDWSPCGWHLKCKYYVFSTVLFLCFCRFDALLNYPQGSYNALVTYLLGWYHNQYEYWIKINIISWWSWIYGCICPLLLRGVSTIDLNLKSLGALVSTKKCKRWTYCVSSSPPNDFLWNKKKEKRFSLSLVRIRIILLRSAIKKKRHVLIV